MQLCQIAAPHPLNIAKPRLSDGRWKPAVARQNEVPVDRGHLRPARRCMSPSALLVSATPAAWMYWRRLCI